MYKDIYDNYNDYVRNMYGYSCQNYNPYTTQSFTQNVSNQDLERCYPEIYRVVYPMVTNVCDNCNETITSQTIYRMTDEVFSALEEMPEVRENEETRITSNNLLRDLIQILILREILSRPNNRPNRPPQRPPFRPGPGNRPPIIR